MIQLFKARIPSSAGEVKYFGSFLRSSLIRALEKIQGNINFLSGRTFPENSESRERCFPKNRNEPDGKEEVCE